MIPDGLDTASRLKWLAGFLKDKEASQRFSIGQPVWFDASGYDLPWRITDISATGASYDLVNRDGRKAIALASELRPMRVLNKCVKRNGKVTTQRGYFLVFEGGKI